MRLRNGARRRASCATAATQRQLERKQPHHDEDHLAAVALHTRRQVASRDAQQESQDERTHLNQDATLSEEDIGHTEGENAVNELHVGVHPRRRRKVTLARAEGRKDSCTRYRKPLQERSVTVDNDNRMQAKETITTSGLKRAASGYYGLLQNAFASEDRIDETNWLTSTLIDLMLWRLASLYPSVHFLATDFCHLLLPSVARQAAATDSTVVTTAHEQYQIRDVLGRAVDYEAKRPLVFVANVGSIHWNLLRLQFDPDAELQLFEPMGRLSSRSGVSYRSVPRCVIEWLDACYPQPKSWITRSVSAITRPQQVSGFDCGVACLLYADKCGQGQPREAINESTSQHDITIFRTELQRQLKSSLLNEH